VQKALLRYAAIRRSASRARKRRAVKDVKPLYRTGSMTYDDFDPYRRFFCSPETPQLPTK
jgi:hypothetical protein